MATKSPKPTEEESDKFIKILQFQSWFFIGVVLVDLLYVVINSLASTGTLLQALSDKTLAIGLVALIGAGFSFGLSYQIQANPDRKPKLFKSYFISLAIVGCLVVFVMAVLSLYEL